VGTTCFERMHRSACAREKARRKFRIETMHDVLFGMVGGCALGLLFTPPFWGAAIGAIIGTCFGLRRSHYSRLTLIATAIDVRRRAAACYAASAKFGTLADEINRELTRHREIDEPDILSSKNPLAGLPDEMIAKTYQSQILPQSAKRRWVADQGYMTRHGAPLLSLVSSLEVSRYLAAGKTVYLVCGSEPMYKKHLIGIFSSNLAQSMTYMHWVEWILCYFEYHLHPITKPTDLDRNLPAGLGVPEGFVTLERDTPSCSRLVALQEIVCSEERRVVRRLLSSNHEEISYRRYHRMSRDPDLEMSTSVSPLLKSPFLGLPGIFGGMGATVAALGGCLAGLDDATSLVAIACCGMIGILMGELTLARAIWRSLI
jgi:hypothetical protein